MTDERYVLMQDIREKKDINRSAGKVKRGAKSRKCTLPHDGKGTKRLNGKVVTYKMNDVVSYADFCDYPPDLQEEYLINMSTTHNVSLRQIEKEVFGRSGSTLNRHMKKIGILSSYKQTVSQIHTTEADRIAFAEFCKTRKEALGIVNEPVRSKKTTDGGSSSPAIYDRSSMSTVNYCELSTIGFDNAVLDKLKGLFAGADVEVTISVRRLDYEK